MFPPEYFVAGWFKWSGAYVGWHMAYRLTMNNKADNSDASKLGDRTLSLFLHPNLHHYVATCHYVNMQMGGDANRQDAINHSGNNIQWHYIYFGYSRTTRRAYW